MTVCSQYTYNLVKPYIARSYKYIYICEATNGSVSIIFTYMNLYVFCYKELVISSNAYFRYCHNLSNFCSRLLLLKV